jgi:photosystem II stability/assembly factor-like uncharacterized protein
MLCPTTGIESHELRVLPKLPGALAVLVLAVATALSQQYGPSLYSGLRWRLIGPFRGGRVTSVAGIPGQPNVYYFGAPGGGVWKTTDAGRVWKPIFDQVPVASVGAVAVAPSSPDIVYVGTGEQTPGDGVYKSIDAGASWKNIGLGDTRYISSILVDPRDPNTVLVAATGDRNPASARGIFKSTDGGKTWNRVLFKEQSAGIDLCFAPDDPRIAYAVLGRRGPGPTAGSAGSDPGIYRSADEGSTWEAVSGHGLPAGNFGRVGVAVAPRAQGRRVVAIMNQGLFRSDDGGLTWRRTTTDPRIIGNGYFSRVFVDPKNPDVVYVAQTSLYRSTDGGQSFTAFAGAPSGDDFHVMWIDPEDSKRIILGVDQGAIVSVDGGQSWSSWYNQPTGQFYHVSTDDAFPYRVYAAQQDSGTAAVISRSDFGEITYRDWFPVAGFEIAHITPDPANPNIVYSGGWYGSVLRFDKTTGQYAHVFVRGGKYRTAGAAPLVFSPQDPHTLYLGTQYVLKTTDAGMSWQPISPDLGETGQPFPSAAGSSSGNAGRRAGAITTLSPSVNKAGVMWAGTSNGLIHMTTDGGATWRDVSPPGLAASTQISTVEASQHDPATAYATVNGFQDPRPYIYRTRDGGHTWQPIVTGLPASAIVRVLRADPVRKGLLYAGTETGVYVSFDDGDHWQPLQLNLPTTSVRDLAVHGDDLVAATYGRALWILDDVTPLRQLDPAMAASDAYVFRPQTGIRVRWDVNQDTPLPPETPAGQNPPDGAILDYYLKSAPSGEIRMAIYDDRGSLVRLFSSEPGPPPPAFPNAPDYWFAPPETLPRSAGLNRFVWDLRYSHPLVLPYSYFGALIDYTEYTLADHAIPGQTPRDQPQGPLVLPGQYSVVVTIGVKQYRQPLEIRLDPRVKASPGALAEQLELEKRIGEQMAISFTAFKQLLACRKAASDRRQRLAGQGQSGGASSDSSAFDALDQKLAALLEGTRTDPGFGPINRDLARLATMVQSADVEPSRTARDAAKESCRALNKVLAGWRQFNSQELSSLNDVLKKSNTAVLSAAPVIPPPDQECGN